MQRAVARTPRFEQGWRSSLAFTPAELLIFLTFAVYGPSFSFAGQFRYVEVVLLAWGLLRFRSIGRFMEGLDWQLLFLFAVNMLAHFVSGLVNDAPSAAVTARLGSYAILAALVPVLVMISRNEPRRVLMMVFGYNASYVFILVVGSSVFKSYALIPWRLGLGMAATMGLAAFFAFQPRFLQFAPLALVAMAGVHFVAGGRSIAAVALLAAALAAFGQYTRANMPVRFDAVRTSIGIALIILGAWAGSALMNQMAKTGMLPEELSAKIIGQVSHSQGLLAAARPDTWAAMYAVTQRPVLGYGSGVFDAEVFAFYSTITAELYTVGDNFGEIFEGHVQHEWNLGIPSHSHVFSSWAEAGVFAALCWIYLLGLALFVFVRASRFNDPWTPLFLLVAIQTMWDLLFSPGPHRMDIAMQILVLAFAVRYFRWFDLHGAIARWQSGLPMQLNRQA